MSALGKTATRCLTDDMRTVIEAGETIDASELAARGCAAPEIAGFKRALWRVRDRHGVETRWKEVYDLWPTGYADANGNMPRSLLLHGGVGCGKSSIAAAAMRRGLAFSMSCGWIDFPSAVEAERDAVGTGCVTGISDLASSQLCTIDDVWALREDPTEHQKEFVAFLISRRERFGYTLYTTNLAPDGLRQISARIASRMMAGPSVPVPGGDARRKKWTVDK